MKGKFVRKKSARPYAARKSIYSKKESKQFRKLSFSHTFEFDNELVNIMDPLDKRYDFLRNPVVQNIYKYQIKYVCEFSKKILKKNDTKFLDWGCGKGPVTYWLKKYGENVISCDVVNTAATSAFGKGNTIITKTGIEVVPLEHEYKLPFDNGSFDVVLSFGVLEHVPNDKESLKEIFRILKPNGLFYCFCLPYKLSYTQNIEHLRGHWYHNRLYTKKQIKIMLQETNFTLLDIWHRALFPKQSFVPKNIRLTEKIDNWLCNYSLLKYFATNIEFVAYKN